MGDKGERGVKNLKKWVTSLWTAPVLYYFMKSMSKFKTKNFRQDASDIKKEVEKNKGILIEALAKKGCALRILGQLDDATEVLFKLLKFTEVTDSKVILFAIYHAISLGHFARAVKLILHHMESKPNSPELEGHLSKLFLDLGWGHCHTLAMESYPARYPGDYELH